MSLEPITRNFKLLGGFLCLDFANTVDWRGRDTQEELLNGYEDLLMWAKYVEILNKREYEALFHVASQSHDQMENVFRRAIALREAIFNIFSAIADEEVPRTVDIDVLNEELSIAYSHLKLGYSENGYSMELWSDGVELDQMLWFVAKSASDLLVSNKLNRVRRCISEECGWLFLDMSRNRSRRWCDMKGCGNRMKARRFYERTHAQY
ncbi:MAG: CGNR zinc finger domain-containing protein [Promethearchaeota archaeon]|jgi:predicted RNA-binding Zn ribbon-like protein